MNPPTTTSRQIVAGEVRAAMGRANVKQSELAARVGMSVGALSERLAGKRPFNTDHLAAIGQALGVDPVTFLDVPNRERATA